MKRILFNFIMTRLLRRSDLSGYRLNGKAPPLIVLRYTKLRSVEIAAAATEVVTFLDRTAAPLSTNKRGVGRAANSLF